MTKEFVNEVNKLDKKFINELNEKMSAWFNERLKSSKSFISTGEVLRQVYKLLGLLEPPNLYKYDHIRWNSNSDYTAFGKFEYGLNEDLTPKEIYLDFDISNKLQSNDKKLDQLDYDPEQGTHLYCKHEEDIWQIICAECGTEIELKSSKIPSDSIKFCSFCGRKVMYAAYY